MRRSLLSRTMVMVFTVGALLLGSLSLAGGATAATTIAPTTTCSNGVDDTPGLGLICEVTIVNRISAQGGSARVTVRECHGAAGVPETTCTTQTSSLTSPVTKVTQCNASTNGGGGTLRCSVSVTNKFIGMATGASAVTVNQCVGSGDGIANNCDPFPATTTGATITQCNGSANGGTLVRLECTASGTEPSSHGVTINQCNGSTNGGGALVICSATVSNVRVAAATPTTGSTAAPTAPPTDVSPVADLPASSPMPVVLLALTVLAFVVIARTRFASRPR